MAYREQNNPMTNQVYYAPGQYSHATAYYGYNGHSMYDDHGDHLYTDDPSYLPYAM